MGVDARIHGPSRSSSSWSQLVADLAQQMPSRYVGVGLHTHRRQTVDDSDDSTTPVAAAESQQRERLTSTSDVDRLL
jgi:hypothetical protein